MRTKKIKNQRQLRRLIQHLLNEEKTRVSELKEFSKTKGGKSVAKAGHRVRSAASMIDEVAQNHTGAMSRTLENISEFVEKVGDSLMAVGGEAMLSEGESIETSLPTIAELRSLAKSLKKLEK